jgi:hypothetical protein
MLDSECRATFSPTCMPLYSYLCDPIHKILCGLSVTFSSTITVSVIVTAPGLKVIKPESDGKRFL